MDELPELTGNWDFVELLGPDLLFLVDVLEPSDAPRLACLQ